eukprot:123325_1
MSSSQPSLLDPDKFGLLLQCRRQMDKLDSSQLQDYGQSVISLLSATQLKQLLFVGCNAMKKHIEYNQLFEMKGTINRMIEDINKAKRSKNKQNTKHALKAPITIIPKHASLTEYIPSDIISNSICPLLKMSSISNLAQCDRQLAIICHTPTSISNLMHRYDPYAYNPRDTEEDTETGLIDGVYYNMKDTNPSALHRFRNVERLAISLAYFNAYASELTNTFTNIKHLSIVDGFSIHIGQSMYPYANMLTLPRLQSICLVNIEIFPLILHIIKPYATQYGKLQSVSFVDCQFLCLQDWLSDHDDDDDEIYSEYRNMLNFILPSQPNSLQVLRLEGSFFEATTHSTCDDVNDQMQNIERIKSSLSNLQGFVYAEHMGRLYSSDIESNEFFHLTTNILNNLSSFKRLESIHIHSFFDQRVFSVLNDNISNISDQIRELCVSVQPRDSSLRCLGTFLPKLQKLCLVTYIPNNCVLNMGAGAFAESISRILSVQTQLKVCQIVIIIDEKTDTTEDTDADFCTKGIVIVNQMMKELVKSFNATARSKRSLMFRLHIKSCHHNREPRCRIVQNREFATTIQTMLLNYLVAYPLGTIQVKLSWNADVSPHDLLRDHSYVEGLKYLFRIDIMEGGNTNDNKQADLCTDMDFEQYAMSVSNKDVDNVENYENKWNVDCRYCCNTPWV